MPNIPIVPICSQQKYVFWMNLDHSNPKKLIYWTCKSFLPSPHTWLSTGWFTGSAPGLFLWKQIYECSSVFVVQAMSTRQFDYNSECVSTETGTHHGKCQQHIIHRHLTVCLCRCVCDRESEGVKARQCKEPHDTDTWGREREKVTKRLTAEKMW